MISNPWLTMWVMPKRTIRAIIQENPYRGVHIITTALALENFFFYGNLWSLGLRTNLLWLVIIGLLISPFLAYLWISIMSHIFYYTGRWFNGSAPLPHLYAAVAWSKIPAFGILFSWVCILLIEPEEAFIFEGGGNPHILIFNFFNLVFAIWSVLLLIGTIQEVQKFSLGRSICNSLVAWSVFSIPVWLLIFIALFILKL